MALLQQISDLVAPLDQPGAPGGVIALARDGVVQECVPFGYANLEHGVKNSPQTVFYIASTSKQFVAASIAVLEADGLLAADDPAAKYLPEIEQLGDIRLHHLIHHTSGIRDKYSLAAIGRLPVEAISTDQGTLALLARQRTLSFAPGSRFMYSNSGYFLLAQVVERCSGRSLADFAQERLFGPLEMSATRFRPDPNDVIPARASGYNLTPAGTWKLAEYTWSSLGPGGVVSTAESLARWGRVFLSGALDGLAARLVSTRPLDDGVPNTYAYGLQLATLEGVPILQHAGGVAGFSAQMIQVPSEALTVVCLANCATVCAALVASRVVEIALGKTPATASPVEPIEPVRAPDPGTYLDADEASVITIETEAGGLHVLGIMGQRVALRPLRPDVWAAAAGEVAFDEPGLSLRLGDEEVRYQRLHDAELADPEELEGSYTSQELGVTLTVARSSGGLQLAWPDQEPAALSCVGEDLVLLTLQGTLVPVRFLRSKGAVSGLRISVDRALGTLFARAPLS
ncbi:MAG: beta-lactamase family protein [Actinomycetota bacterium]|nr:beta-lactamase family protein [Actinomycetota bacterium]